MLLWLPMLAAAEPGSEPQFCSYSSYQWSVEERKAVAFVKVHKLYAQLTDEERDQRTGCSVCEQDQRLVTLPGVAPFKVCRYLVKDIQRVIADLLAHGEPLRTVTGYRVGRTRGNVNAQGLRTRFSNHSFGIALDINAAHNGLYADCESYSAQCRLIKGGHWQPGSHAESLTAQSPVVILLKNIGLQWGGEIAGRQKDFMHFSPSGY